jgi:hypothetical protein
MMAIIHAFPKSRSKINEWAYNYCNLYEQEGWYAAGKYFGDLVPEQLKEQTITVIRKHLLRRGIDVSF